MPKNEFCEDKLAERHRYDERAKNILAKNLSHAPESERTGAAAVPATLRAPYLYFETQLCRYLRSDCRVLEIGSGAGMHTGALLQAGGRVTATDISRQALKVLRKRFDVGERLCLRVADMECLPFKEKLFDVVASAGSLSYGDNLKVMLEIHRVLKPDGVFICVDSLNHHPLYRFNRWLHYRRGERTLSTLRRMPNLEMLRQYERRFGSVETRFFGSISWLTPVLSKMFGDHTAAYLSDKVDGVLNVKRAAFKFVMVARKDCE